STAGNAGILSFDKSGMSTANSRSNLIAEAVNVFPIACKVRLAEICRKVQHKICIHGCKTGSGHIVGHQMHREPSRFLQSQGRDQGQWVGSSSHAKSLGQVHNADIHTKGRTDLYFGSKSAAVVFYQLS